MKRKLLSVLLTFCLAFSLLPTAALADGTADPVAQIGEKTYATLKAAFEEAKDGDTVTLLKDVETNNIEDTVEARIIIDKAITLNLNDKTIRTPDNMGNNNTNFTALIVDADVIINATTGGINTGTNGGYGINVRNGATLTINGGTYYGGGTAVQVQKGTLIINDGTFACEPYSDPTYGYKFLINCIDAAWKDGTAKISIKGGTFVKFDPSDSASENPKGNFCASGYVAVKSGTDDAPVWTVEDHRVAEVGNIGYSTLADAVAAAQSGETVKLLADTTVSAPMLISKDITIDLNGKQIKTACTQAFKIVAKDQYAGGSLKVTGEGTINANNQNGTFFLVGTETSESPKKSTLMIDKNVKLINGAYAVWVQHADPVKASYNVEVDIYGSLSGIEPIYVSGNVQGTQDNMPVIRLHDGANIEVNRDDLEVYIGGYAKMIIDKATITNTVKDGNALTISAGELEINGATIIGGDTVGKNVAGGGGAVDVTASSAVFVKQHTTNLPLKITINDGTFKAAVPFNQAAGQATTPAPDKITLSIKGGYFVSTGSAADGSVAVKSANKTGFITGGYFTSDPSTYKATDYYVVASDVDGYTYMVTATAPTDDQKITVVDKTNASVDPSITGNDKTAIESAMSSGKTNVDGVAEAVSTTVKTGIVNDAKNKANNVPTGEVTSTEIEVKVNVSVTEANLSEGSMTFKAEPVANVKVNGIKLQDSENKPVEVPVSNAMLNGKPITVKLPLPAGFKLKQIIHKSAGYADEYILQEGNAQGLKSFKIVEEDGVKIAVFTVSHFSDFELSGKVTYVAPSYYSGSSSYDPTYSVSTPSKTENGTVTVSPKSASKGDTVTVTVKPDSGYVLETLTVTDKNGNELTLKDKGNGKYTFTMPAGKVEVKATFMEDNSMLNFFYDVPNNAYFYEAVKWAVKNGITTGVGNDLFAPEQPCTRAQIVTFLWRAAGSPEPKGAASGMTDVVSGSYYEKAVAWAIENGITTGTTTSTFSPDATCTRAQAVTFLARALKAKAASAAEFSDVPTDSYFADAVAWAAANGVTEGIGGGLFGSDNDCTRGQIVTFLYRAYNK